MIRILVVSTESKFSAALFSILNNKNEMEYLKAESGAQGLSMIKENDFQLIVANEKLTDMTGLAFAEKVVSVNAMINQAVASSLSHDEFHEISEGLGLLMSLPLEPKEEDVERLVEYLQNILKHTAGNKPVIQ